MAWQLTSALVRASHALGVRRKAKTTARKPAGIESAGPARGENALHAAFTLTHRAWSKRDQAAFAAACRELDHDGVTAAQRAVAAGADGQAACVFATRWAEWPADTKAFVAAPLGGTKPRALTLGGTLLAQSDPTTCGAASAAIMMAAGDPRVAAWLATGEVIGTPGPELLADIADSTPGTVSERWAVLQADIHRRTTARALAGLLPWPRSLGTPPWGLARVLRFAQVHFIGVALSDSHQDDLESWLDHARAALADGIPVPMYTGGDSSRGVATAIPRHVVLLTGHTPRGFSVYEPGSGEIHSLSSAQILAGGAPLRALGNWRHVVWMVLPRPRTKLEV